MLGITGNIWFRELHLDILFMEYHGYFVKIINEINQQDILAFLKLYTLQIRITRYLNKF